MTEYVSVTNDIGATYITGLKMAGVTTKYITSAATGELFIIYGMILETIIGCCWSDCLLVVICGHS